MLRGLLKSGGSLRSQPRCAVRPRVLDLSTLPTDPLVRSTPEPQRLSRSKHQPGNARAGGELCDGGPESVRVLYHPINPNPGNPNNGLFYLWQVGMIFGL